MSNIQNRNSRTTNYRCENTGRISYKSYLSEHTVYKNSPVISARVHNTLITSHSFQFSMKDHGQLHHIYVEATQILNYGDGEMASDYSV
jgi:hypothetical protein